MDHQMSYFPNIERIDSGPAWMDKTAYTEEQRLADSEYMAKQEAAALADLYAAPALSAIRAIPVGKFSKDVLRNILFCCAAIVVKSAWQDTDAGELAVGAMDDLANDLEVL